MGVIFQNKTDATMEFANASTKEVVLKVGGNSRATVKNPQYQVPRTVKIPLTAVNTGGGVFAFQNPEKGAIFVTNIILDVTTVATSACTLDVGTTGTSATTVSDTLIDGLDVNSATGAFSNIANPGSNGKALQRLAKAKWVTASVKTGASAGLVGYAYITYVVA